MTFAKDKLCRPFFQSLQPFFGNIFYTKVTQRYLMTTRLFQILDFFIGYFNTLGNMFSRSGSKLKMNRYSSPNSYVD